MCLDALIYRSEKQVTTGATGLLFETGGRGWGEDTIVEENANRGDANKHREKYGKKGKKGGGKTHMTWGEALEHR